MFAVERLELNLKKGGYPLNPEIQKMFLDELKTLPPDAGVKKWPKRKVQLEALLDQCTSTTPITGAPALSAREQGLHHQPAAVKLEASEFEDAHNSAGVKRKVRNPVVEGRIPHWLLDTAAAAQPQQQHGRSSSTAAAAARPQQQHGRSSSSTAAAARPRQQHGRGSSTAVAAARPR